MEQKMSRRTNNNIEGNQTSKKHRRESRGGMHRHQTKKFHRKVPERDPGRKCQICGKNPYPNLYFCPKCHGHTEYYSDSDEEDYNVR